MSKAAPFMNKAPETSESNPLLQNIDRTIFTFNMHNLTEMCFNHVYTKQHLRAQVNLPDTPLKQGEIDKCIQKYMHAFRIVQH